MLRLELDPYQTYPYMRIAAWLLIVTFLVSGCTNFYNVIYKEMDLFRVILGVLQIIVSVVWFLQLKRVSPFLYFIELCGDSVRYRNLPWSERFISKKEIEEIQFDQSNLIFLLKSGKKKKLDVHFLTDENKKKLQAWLVANKF